MASNTAKTYVKRYNKKKKLNIRKQKKNMTKSYINIFKNIHTA